MKESTRERERRRKRGSEREISTSVQQADREEIEKDGTERDRRERERRVRGKDKRLRDVEGTPILGYEATKQQDGRFYQRAHSKHTSTEETLVYKISIDPPPGAGSTYKQCQTKLK